MKWLAGAAAAAAACFGLACPASATFPGRNGRVAHSPLGSRGDSEGIWTMRPDGSFRRPLVRRAGAGQASWSPDGRRIAFTRRYADASAIFTARANGSHMRRAISSASAPAWAPDGRRIAFLRVIVHGTIAVDVAVWVARVDGKDQRR